jgi:hypothetical protein
MPFGPLAISCLVCGEKQYVALSCRWCDQPFSPFRRNITMQVRNLLVRLIEDEAEMLRRKADELGEDCIADWIRGSTSRRKRARAALGRPKGWNFRRGRPSRRTKPDPDQSAETDPLSFLDQSFDFEISLLEFVERGLSENMTSAPPQPLRRSEIQSDSRAHTRARKEAQKWARSTGSISSRR